MENYDILLNEIKDYLKKEEVNGENCENEIISLYDLYNIVNDELKELRNITINSKINKELKKTTLARIISQRKYNTSIIANQDISKIIVEMRNEYSINWWNILTIYKDKNVDELYFSQEIDSFKKPFSNFIKKHYDLILSTLTTAEYYVNLLGELKFFSIKFSDELFSAILIIEKSGEVKVDIEILKEHKLYDEFYKKWYKRENISDFTNKQRDEILKRIPVIPYTYIGRSF